MAESLNDRVTLHCGDCLDVLDKLDQDSIDACVCDPPYHLQSITKRFAKTGRTDKTRTTSGPHQRTANGFMNQQWDGGDVAFRVDTWERVLRVLKPGAYLVAFSSTRTFGRMSAAIEDAGFITHPFVAWIFGQGFPKAHRITASGLAELDRETGGWEGWRYGTQSLKPAIEPIYIGQKPFEGDLTGTENVQRWGTGALNIDGCRVETDETITATRNVALGSSAGGIYGKANKPGVYSNRRDGEASADRRYLDEGATNFAAKPGPRDGDLRGRWPANVIHDGSEEVVGSFPSGLKSGAAVSRSVDTAAGYRPNAFGAESRPSGVTTEWYGDEGSAARFFYTAKADADDRLGSKHPTVKPLDLMQYLVRLVTPPRGLVLDPFAGTGTTGEACMREGMRALLIEREAAYQDDIRRRMRLAASGNGERKRESIKAKNEGKPLDHGPLFGS